MPLLDRIEAALARVRNRHGLMRIPAEATDIDIVILDCREEIARLRAELATRTAERDEARRQACYFQAKYIDRCACPPYMSIAKYVTQDAMRLAKDRGWDCFEESHGNIGRVRVRNGGEP